MAVLPGLALSHDPGMWEVLLNVCGESDGRGALPVEGVDTTERAAWEGCSCAIVGHAPSKLLGFGPLLRGTHVHHVSWPFDLSWPSALVRVGDLVKAAGTGDYL